MEIPLIRPKSLFLLSNYLSIYVVAIAFIIFNSRNFCYRPESSISCFFRSQRIYKISNAFEMFKFMEIPLIREKSFILLFLSFIKYIGYRQYIFNVQIYGTSVNPTRILYSLS